MAAAVKAQQQITYSSMLIDSVPLFTNALCHYCSQYYIEHFYCVFDGDSFVAAEYKRFTSGNCIFTLT